MGVTDSQDCGGDRTVERSSAGEESLTTKLVDAIAEFKGIDPVDPGFSLYESVDMDALEEFVASTSGTELRTTFRAVDVLVCVRKTAKGETVVTVSDPDE